MPATADKALGRAHEPRRGRTFDEARIHDVIKEAGSIQEQYKQVIEDVQKNADKLVDEKDKEIERLLKMNEELRLQMKGQKTGNHNR